MAEFAPRSRRRDNFLRAVVGINSTSSIKSSCLWYMRFSGGEDVWSYTSGQKAYGSEVSPQVAPGVSRSITSSRPPHPLKLNQEV